MDESAFVLSIPYWQKRNYPKGEFYNEYKSVCQHLGFILDGIFRVETRYLDLIEQHPDMYNAIPMYPISSCLGSQDPSLSHMRKKMAGRSIRRRTILTRVTFIIRWVSDCFRVLVADKKRSN